MYLLSPASFQFSLKAEMRKRTQLHRTVLVMLALLGITTCSQGSSPYPPETSFEEPLAFPFIASCEMPNLTSYGLHTWLGSGISGIGDFNGDTVEDTAIGAMYATPPGSMFTESGVVFVFWSSPGMSSWPSVITALPNASRGLVIYGSTTGQHIGAGVFAGGDISNDGLDDMIIGSSSGSSSSSGMVYIVFGRLSNLWGPTFSLASLDGINGFKVVAPQPTWSPAFGKIGSGVVDYNADSFMDIWLPDYDADSDRGRIALIFGRASWPSVITIGTSSAITSFISNNTDENGVIESAFLDLNLDGNTDIVFSTPSAQDDSGFVHIIWGGQSLGTEVYFPVDSVSRGCYFRGSAMDSFGSGVTTADFNGDSNTDLVIGSTGQAQIWVILALKEYANSYSLNQSSFPNALHFTGPSSFESFGSSVLSGDFNSDGIADIVIGAPSFLMFKGRAYIWFGSINPTSLTLSFTDMPNGTLWACITSLEVTGWASSLGILHGPRGSGDFLLSGARNANDNLGRAFLLSHLTCLDTNSTNGNCSKCAIGYGLDSQGSCTPCKAFFYSSGMTTCLPISTVAGCQHYSTTTGHCLQCRPGFGYNEAQSSCTSCTIGYWSLGVKRCQKCSSPCLSCNISNGMCQECPAGFEPRNYGCTACTSLYFSNGYTTCQPCSATCSQCRADSGWCSRCNSGYILNATTGLCSMCTELYSGKCTSCLPGYGLVAGSCTPCSAGFYSTGAEVCLKCQKHNCTACDSGSGKLHSL